MAYAVGLLAGAREAALTLGRAYSSLLFLASPRAGFCLLFGTFLYPNIAVSGLICLVTAWGLVHAFGQQTVPFRAATILYNALLAGLFVGYLFSLSFPVVLLLAATAGFTMLLTLFLENFVQSHGLPLLSLPFTITAALMALGATRFSNLIDATAYFHEYPLPLATFLPSEVPTFLRSIGAVFCIPDPVFGAIVWGAVLWHSPLIGMALVAGFAVGYGAESLLQLQGAEPGGSHYFNDSLTFAAVAAVFLVPSRTSLWLATFGAVGASIVCFAASALASPLHIPITALPFNIMVILLLRSVQSVQPLRVSSTYAGDPEETIERSRLYSLRCRGGEPGVFCPFEGVWTVQQGFDGEWTHKGNWRHALDFVVHGEDGKTYKDRGFELSDYHAFGRKILAPVEGYVVGLCANVDDNPISRVENHQNWGNYVIVRSIFGYYVVLAHLKKGSIPVALGAYVTVNTVVGECGNSGYSQEPHLHMQVQWSQAIGAYTVPFHVVNFREKARLRFHDVPVVGAEVEAIPMNLAIERLLTFRLGETYRFERLNAGRRSDVTVTVGLDEKLGTLFLSDGRSRLSFGRLGAQFFFYGFEGRMPSFLGHLMLAAPRIPITYKDAAEFVDHLPLRVTDGALARWGRLWLGMVSRNQWMRATTYHFDPSALELTGAPVVRGQRQATCLRFDPVYGFKEVKVGDVEYVRKVA